MQVSPRLRRQQVATASNIESRGKCGIGVVLEPNHRLGHLQVLELTPHGPAARSGLISVRALSPSRPPPALFPPFFKSVHV